MKQAGTSRVSLQVFVKQKVFSISKWVKERSTDSMKKMINNSDDDTINTEMPD